MLNIVNTAFSSLPSTDVWHSTVLAHSHSDSDTDRQTSPVIGQMTYSWIIMITTQNQQLVTAQRSVQSVPCKAVLSMWCDYDSPANFISTSSPPGCCNTPQTHTAVSAVVDMTLNMTNQQHCSTWNCRTLTPTVATWVQLPAPDRVKPSFVSFNIRALWRSVTWDTAIKHPVSDPVKSSFVIFDIRALWRSGLSVRMPGCQKLQMTA